MAAPSAKAEVIDRADPNRPAHGVYFKDGDRAVRQLLPPVRFCTRRREWQCQVFFALDFFPQYLD
jgi:hypothetical protein